MCRIFSCGFFIFKNVFIYLSCIAVAFATSHLYTRLAVAPIPSPIPYFPAPVHLKGSSTPPSTGVCALSPIQWSTVPDGFQQENGTLTWRHSHPTTATLIGDIVPVRVQTANYETDCQGSCNVRLAQNSKIEIFVNSSETFEWNLIISA